MTIWRTRIACSIPKATNTHSEYVILIAFPLHQWLNKRASVLRYTYITCLFFFNFLPVRRVLIKRIWTRGLWASCSPPVNFIRPCQWSYSSYRQWPGSKTKNSVILNVCWYWPEGSRRFAIRGTKYISRKVLKFSRIRYILILLLEVWNIPNGVFNFK